MFGVSNIKEQLLHCGVVMDEDSFTASNLRRFSVKTLQSILKEMSVEVQRASQHLVHMLVEKDKTAKQNEDRLNRISELLGKYAEANGLKTNFKFQLSFTNYYNDTEFRKWIRSWSLVSQIGHGIMKNWRQRVWEGVALYCTRDINWEQVLHHLTRQTVQTEREMKWRQAINKSLEHLSSNGTSAPSLTQHIAAVEDVLVSYSQVFPQSVYCPEFTTLASITLKMAKDRDLSLKVLVTFLEHKLPPKYFSEGYHAIKTDLSVLNDLIDHFLPQLAAHMKLLRSKSSAQILKFYSFRNPPSVSDCTSFEPPLVDAVSLQWFLSCFTACLPWTITKRVFDSLLVDNNEILVFTGLAIWMLLERDLIEVRSVPDFYDKASKVIEQLKKGTLIPPTVFIQIVYTLRQCATDEFTVKKLRARHLQQMKVSSADNGERSVPLRPPPSQGGNLLLPRSSVPLSPTLPSNRTPTPEINPITAKAECPQIKKSGFLFSYAYAADVPVDLPAKHAPKFNKHSTRIMKSGQLFNMGACADSNIEYLFTDSLKK